MDDNATSSSNGLGMSSVDGVEVLERRTLDVDDAGVPEEALAIGGDTVPREALVDMRKRDPSTIVVDAADGQRFIRRGGDQSAIRSLIARAIGRLNGDSAAPESADGR